MATKEKPNQDELIPGPDTFRFEEYISGISTFPTFSHTAYLDQASGNALLKIYDECEKVAQRGKEVEARLEARSENSSLDLVDDEGEKLQEELSSLKSKAEKLEAQKLNLEKKVRASALTLHFQVGTPKKLNLVVRQAEEEYRKKHGKIREDDLAYGEFMLAARLEAYCTKITLADGQDQDPPTREGFLVMVGSLIPSESIRLATRLYQELDSAESWADRLDAGFLGGSSDMASEPVGAPGSKDSTSMGRPSSSASRRGGI